MTVFRIPNQGQLSQPNKGDIQGSLSSSLNLDLRTNPGRIRLSPRLKVLTKDNDSSITGMGLPIAFVNYGHTDGSIRTLVITGKGDVGSGGSGQIFMSSNSDYGAFVDLAGNYATNDPTTISALFSDAIVWRNDAGVRVYVSVDPSVGDMEVYELAGDTWDTNWGSSDISINFGSDHPVNFWIDPNGSLHFTNEGKVGTVTTAEALVSGSGTIDFANKYRPIWGRANSNRNWIALMTWSSAALTKADGFIAEWDGAGTAANKIYKIDAPCALSGCVCRDIFYFIDAYGILKKYSSNGFVEVARLPVANMNIEMPGVYNPLTNNKWIHHRGMDVVNDKINIVVNNFVSTGVYVEEMPSGVWEFDPENPSLGLYHKNSPCADTTDWGQQAIVEGGAGAIFPLKDTNGNSMVGFSYYTDDATTQKYGIFYDDIVANTSKRGSFTTTFMSSEQIDDSWAKADYRHARLPSGDKVIGKYRTYKNSNFPFIASATWTSTTTFTSTDTDFANVSGGEEVEPVMGKSASTTAHVSSISYSNPTYTVTLDEAIGQSSGTFKVKVDNFKKMGVISATDETETSLPIGDTATKVQIKTEIRATGDFEVDDVTIISNTHKEARA